MIYLYFLKKYKYDNKYKFSTFIQCLTKAKY